MGFLNQTKTSPSGYKLNIPENIKTKVHERGFFVYNWIGVEDVKNSIERDFLKLLNIIGLPFAIVAVGSFLLTFQIGVFIGVSIILATLLFFYLSVIGSIRSLKLAKNGYVVITNSSISVNGKIFSKDDNYILAQELEEIEKEFEEKIFLPSNLQNTKKGFLQKLKVKVATGYENIFDNFRDRLLFIVLALYTGYVLLMAGVYIFGSILIMLFGIFLNAINRFILIKSGNEVMMIQDLFEKIHFESENIHHEKDQVLIALENAKIGNYEEGMVGDINSGIEKISQKTMIIIEWSKILKQKLQASKYAQIFDFGIYNTWIKTQVREPLIGLLKLLETNKTDLELALRNIQSEIQNRNDERLVATLSLQEKRLEIQLQNVQNYISKITSYIKNI